MYEQLNKDLKRSLITFNQVDVAAEYFKCSKHKAEQKLMYGELPEELLSQLQPKEKGQKQLS